MVRLLFAILIACCAFAQDLALRADQFVQAYVSLNRFQGSALLAQDGQPIFRKSYGLANAEWNIGNTPDTKFRLGSITKQFTSALILQLVEQGQVKLDDSIRKYYPDSPESWQPVTIHHLLCHESGIPSYTELPGFFAKQSFSPRTPAEIVKLTQDKPLEFPPGTKFKYDNTGYILLGIVIEKVTGKTYEARLREAILDPLGMHDTGYDSFTAVLPHRAEGYRNDKGKLVRAAYLDMTLPYAAGALYSTVDDLLKWDQALYGDKVVSEASKQKMWTPNLSDYGYGWSIAKRFGFNQVLEHGGGINGFNTMIMRVPEKKLVAVVLSNVNSGAPGNIASGLIALALGKPVQLPGEHKRISLASDQLAPYEGTYVGPALTLTIKPESDHLTAQATNQGRLTLQPMSPTRFFNEEINAEIEFHRDAGGKVTSLTLHQNGADLVFKRQ
jgi:CubicO group peptidase (beta-lactamase class C family)